MEKNPRALKRTFAQETAQWVDEVSHSKSGQYHPTRAGKKRTIHQDSDAEDDSVVRVSSSHSQTANRHTVSVILKNPDISTEGTASKRTQSKHEDEIPKFKDSHVPDRAQSDERSRKPQRKLPHAPSKAQVRRGTSRRQVDSDDKLTINDASGTNSDTEDSGVEVVLPQSGKLKIRDQHRRVRRVIQRSIYTMLVDIALKNAFPDGPQKQGQIISRALSSAATRFGYGDILKRLKKQDAYAAELAKIPSQRIPAFRGSVRKLAEGQPCTAFGLMFGDKDKGDWLQEGFRYIYPFDYESKTIKASKPYSPPVFLETLRVAFFKKPSSFGFEVSKYFESSLPDKPDEKEIPAAMLSLVATALHAAIEDCKHNHMQPRDFSANDYWSVYKDHIQELSTIRAHGPTQFHVSSGNAPMGHSGQAGAPRKSFLNVAAMAVE
ncbi:hypothetical protein BC628DRAFT_1525366 [Trametes gibbosa]|nr:hypothetical protein BC628DRAFT_1525366 [Trametes gibbosa]